MGSVALSRPDIPTMGRLRRGPDFQRVLTQGTRAVRGPVAVTATPGPEGLRVGFATGRRLGGAVARNRARRRLREAWRAGLAAPGVQVRGGFDVVVVARPAVLGAAFGELEASLVRALVELGVVAR